MYNLKKINFNTIKKDNTTGVFEISPLVKGFGYTIGSGIRRTLFSATRGAAIVAVSIEGIQHEFSTIEGATDDVLQIILKLKKVIVKMSPEFDLDDVVELKIDVKGPGDVTAGDISEDAGVEIINKDFVITTLNTAKDTFKATLKVKPGFGYEQVDEDAEVPRGTILLDANYTPIVNVSYDVDVARVGRDDNFDKLILNVETDGSVDPEEAVRNAAKVLKEFFYKVETGKDYTSEQDKELEEKLAQEESVQSTETAATTQSGIALDEVSLEELRLPTRTVNALKKAGINTLADLAERSEDDLLRVRNLGEKSIREIIALLEKEGLK